MKLPTDDTWPIFAVARGVAAELPAPAGLDYKQAEAIVAWYGTSPDSLLVLWDMLGQAKYEPATDDFFVAMQISHAGFHARQVALGKVALHEGYMTMVRQSLDLAKNPAYKFSARR